MDTLYRSLDPSFQKRQVYTDRQIIYNRRVSQARGEPLASLTSGLLIAANVCTYHHYFSQKFPTFSLIPTNLKLTTQFYMGLTGVLFVSALLGSSMGTTLFGDSNDLKYLLWNKSSILEGTKPYDRQI